MKTYFRVLSFLNPFSKYAIPYFIFTGLSVVFYMLTFYMLVPMLDIIFNQYHAQVIEKPAFELTKDYGNKLVLYYYAQIQQSGFLGKIGPLIVVCLVILASNLLSNFFKYFAMRILLVTKKIITQGVRQALFEKMVRLDLNYFSEEKKGEMLSRFSFDINNIEHMSADTLKAFMREPLMLISNLLFLFFISWKLTLVSALVLPIGGTFIALISKKLRKRANNINDSNAEMMSITEESITGLRVIKSFASEKYISQKYRDVNEDNANERMRFDLRIDFSSLFSEFSGISMAALIVFIGGSMILSGETELKGSEFITYLAIFSQLLGPAKSLTSSMSYLQKGIVSAQKIFDVLDSEPNIVEVENPKTITALNHGIEFKNVSFGYNQYRVLKNINLHIPAGKTVALVGPSGGGKSTLADLVSRFYDVTDGSISFEGTDVKNISLASLRSKIAIVSQEPVLFNDTIFNNIAFGMPNATQQQVENAARVANAHEFITKTELGYQTVIGDRGNKLSGGQKQRLSISRAVLKNPEILILDEATSALDTESERLVQDALNNLMSNRTSLVIAHRLSTIQHADIIVVLSEGEIKEKGSHQALMSQNGLYSKLVSLQTNTSVL